MMTRRKLQRRVSVNENTENTNPNGNCKRNELELYLTDFDKKVECQIEAVESYSVNLLKTIQDFTKSRLAALPKKMKETTMGELLKNKTEMERMSTAVHDLISGISQLQPSGTVKASKADAKPQVQQRLTEVRQSSRLRSRKVPETQVKTRGKSKTIPKGTRRLPDETPVKTSSDVPIFTPKFDPRLPLTPATGFRSIRPGEQFVIMSLSGSPLGNVNPQAPASTLVTLQDGKSISISASDTHLDEETRDKLMRVEEQLLSIIQVPT